MVGFIAFHKSDAVPLRVWLSWVASDALGIIMVAPLLIGLQGLRHNPPEKWELGEGTLTLMGLAPCQRARVWLPCTLLVHRPSARALCCPYCWPPTAARSSPLPPYFFGFFRGLDGHLWHG